MAELANCKRCGNVFVKSLREVCHECYKEEEDAFQTVSHFLKQQENREATLYEIADATGIEEALIIKFVKEKRLTPIGFPKLAYPCERCGGNITASTICSKCKEELIKDLQQFEEVKNIKERKKKEEERIYFTFDKHKK